MGIIKKVLYLFFGIYLGLAAIGGILVFFQETELFFRILFLTLTVLLLVSSYILIKRAIKPICRSKNNLMQKDEPIRYEYRDPETQIWEGEYEKQKVEIIDRLSQKEETLQIMEETPMEDATTVEEADRLARERSDRLYEERSRRIRSFDPHHINTSKISHAPLNSLERLFLKQMNGQPVKFPHVYAYWTYEYGVNFSDMMERLIGNGYLKIGGARESLEKIKMDKLKDLLRKKNLPLGRKKADVVDRIIENFSEDEIRSILPDDFQEFYVLTEDGTEEVKDIEKSGTKNIEYEDACISRIKNGDIDGAYREVCKNEISKIIPRGVGVDWEKELERGLSPNDRMIYQYFLECDLFKIMPNIPQNAEPYFNEIKYSVILSIMLGLSFQNSEMLLDRLTKGGIVGRAERIKIMEYLTFWIMEARDSLLKSQR